jgi:spermidine synthase
VKYLAAILGTAIALFAVAPAHAEYRLVHSERSLYREVLVYEQGGERCMCFTRQCRIGRQSCIDLKQPERFTLSYTRLMLAGLLFASPEPKRILILGLGGGSIPTALKTILPDSQVDVVEIDPAVTRVAGKYFRFQDGPNLHVTEIDGRVFVKRALRAGQKYDAVLLDAFDHEYIPEHLLTKEFLSEVKGILGPRGVIVANTFSLSRLYDHESATYAAVFGRFYNLTRENRVIVTRLDGPPPMAEIRERATKYSPALQRFGANAGELAELFDPSITWDTTARVLTDQYSPANLLNR